MVCRVYCTKYLQSFILSWFCLYFLSFILHSFLYQVIIFLLAKCHPSLIKYQNCLQLYILQLQCDSVIDVGYLMHIDRSHFWRWSVRDGCWTNSSSTFDGCFFHCMLKVDWFISYQFRNPGTEFGLPVHLSKCACHLFTCLGLGSERTWLKWLFIRRGRKMEDMFLHTHTCMLLLMNHVGEVTI